MTLLTCAAVRRRLQAFYDRELAVGETDRRRVPRATIARPAPAICAKCRTSGRRCGSPPRRDRPTTGPGLRRVSSAACAPRRTSRGTARARRALDDVHLVWIGLAATAAAVRLRRHGAVDAALCVAGAEQFARGDDRREGGPVRIGSEPRAARRPHPAAERARERRRLRDARKLAGSARTWSCRCRRWSRGKDACPA